MYEVEAKISISKNDYNILYTKISKFADKVGDFYKKDIYYSDKDDYFMRIREFDNKEFFLTIKNKTIDLSIETNDELEFQIDSFEDFNNLFFELGFSKIKRKEKISQVFRYKNANLELNEIKSLGYFLEIEILLENESEIFQAKKDLENLFLNLGYSSADFEKRYYLDLLDDLG